jgi:hypothetical protein
MTTNEMIKLPAPSADPLSATSNASSCGSEPRLLLEDTFEEILPLVGAVPVAGPPVIPFVGAWALFVLMLTGPFLLLVTLGFAELIVVAIIAAVLAPPYFLVRLVRRYLTRHPERRAPVDRFPARHPIAVSLLPESPDALVSGVRLSDTPGPHIDNPYIVT